MVNSVVIGLLCSDSIFRSALLGYCCIFGFPKYTHSVCWWRLAISAGGASHLHVSFSLTPEN